MDKPSKIGIVGHNILHEKIANHLVAMAALKKDKPQIITLDMNEIEINGIRYQKIEEPPKKTGKASAYMAMAMAMGGFDQGQSDYQRKRPIVDIVEEFKLIQAKQSKLPRADRDWVEHVFHKQYKPI